VTILQHLTSKLPFLVGAEPLKVSESQSLKDGLGFDSATNFLEFVVYLKRHVA
jgi:hypothetical protein